MKGKDIINVILYSIILFIVLFGIWWLMLVLNFGICGLYGCTVKGFKQVLMETLTTINIIIIPIIYPILIISYINKIKNKNIKVKCKDNKIYADYKENKPKKEKEIDYHASWSGKEIRNFIICLLLLLLVVIITILGGRLTLITVFLLFICFVIIIDKIETNIFKANFFIKFITKFIVVIGFTIVGITIISSGVGSLYKLMIILSLVDCILMIFYRYKMKKNKNIKNNINSEDKINKEKKVDFKLLGKLWLKALLVSIIDIALEILGIYLLFKVLDSYISLLFYWIILCNVIGFFITYIVMEKYNKVFMKYFVIKTIIIVIIYYKYLRYVSSNLALMIWYLSIISSGIDNLTLFITIAFSNVFITIILTNLIPLITSLVIYLKNEYKNKNINDKENKIKEEKEIDYHASWSKKEIRNFIICLLLLLLAVIITMLICKSIVS